LNTTSIIGYTAGYQLIMTHHCQLLNKRIHKHFLRHCHVMQEGKSKRQSIGEGIEDINVQELPAFHCDSVKRNTDIFIISEYSYQFHSCFLALFLQFILELQDLRRAYRPVSRNIVGSIHWRAQRNVPSQFKRLNEQPMEMAGAGGVGQYIGFCHERNKSIGKRRVALFASSTPQNRLNSRLMSLTDTTFVIPFLQVNTFLEVISPLLKIACQQFRFPLGYRQASHISMLISCSLERLILSLIF
jgi:hypothetical protein